MAGSGTLTEVGGQKAEDRREARRWGGAWLLALKTCSRSLLLGLLLFFLIPTPAPLSPDPGPVGWERVESSCSRCSQTASAPSVLERGKREGSSVISWGRRTRVQWDGWRKV